MPWWLRPFADRKKEDDDSEPSGDQPEGGAETQTQKEPESPPEPDRSPSRSAQRPDGRQGSRAGSGRGGARRGSRSGGNGRPRQTTARSEPEEAPTFDLASAADYVELKETLATAPEERTQTVYNEEKKLALFCDLENIALGVRDSDVKKFDIHLVLERLLEKGKIIVKKAYCDWERYSDYKRTFHEAAIELIDIPQKYYSGKNSADIKMVVDAMDLCYSKEHLNTFVVLSGDSDFSPLVSKLKENNKYVIGVGVKNASSNLLIDNCDEFIYYEDIWRDRKQAPKLDGMSKKQSEAFNLMVDSIQALIRENKDVLWGSMIKQTMQRKKPSFSESYHGYSSFSELLEDAAKHNVIKLKKDQRSGTYIVTGFAAGK